jgi:hypothetical protein
MGGGAEDTISLKRCALIQSQKSKDNGHWKANTVTWKNLKHKTTVVKIRKELEG